MSTFRVGIVGTGYAARARAEAVIAEPRAQLVAIAGSDMGRTAELCRPYGAEALTSSALLQRRDIDLVIVASRNGDHGPVAKAAVCEGKAVVVEYPLALDLEEAEAIADRARQEGTFLHVEHIELLSGIHQTIREALPEVGKPFYVRYVSTAPQQPAPQRWSYSLTQFGFPLIGALSRVHRLIDLFGPVKRVFCSQQVWSDAGEPLSDGQEYFGTVLCTAQLRFTSGLLAEVVYGKGQALWDGQRQFEVQGSQGRLRVGSGAGELLLANGTSRELRVGSRRGLFVRDTAAVLDSLQEPSGDCYVTVQQSLYALRVADAARRSAIARQPIVISA